MKLPAGRIGLGRALRATGLRLTVPGLALLAPAARPPARHAVAYVGPNGQLLNIEDSSVQAPGAWNSLTFSTPGVRGQLEYYVDLVRSGEQRSFRFEWPGGLGVEGVGYEGAQP